MSKNADFSETCFSHVNDVGLSMYVVYVVTKNGIDLFHWELNCFALKIDSIRKSGIMRRTLWFVRFHNNWPVKRSCMYTYIHMWLVYIHSWGNWVVLLCFGSLTLIVQSCKIYYTNLVRNIHWTWLLWNSFMNGLLWINKECMNDWWVLNMMFIMMMCIFSFTWIVRIHEVVELLWWWCWWIIYVCVHICCWWIFLHENVGEIVGECMYIYSRWNCRWL